MCVFQVSFYVAENEIGNYKLCCEYALFKNWFLINSTASAEAFCPSIRRLAACALWPSGLCCKCQRVLVLWISLHFFLVFNQSALFIILLIRSIWRLITRPSVRAGITFLCWKKIPLPGTLWLHTAQTQEGSTFQRHTTLLSPAAALLSPPADCFFFPPVTDCSVPVSECSGSIVGESKTCTIHAVPLEQSQNPKVHVKTGKMWCLEKEELARKFRDHRIHE